MLLLPHDQLSLLVLLELQEALLLLLRRVYYEVRVMLLLPLLGQRQRHTAAQLLGGTAQHRGVHPTAVTACGCAEGSSCRSSSSSSGCSGRERGSGTRGTPPGCPWPSHGRTWREMPRQRSGVAWR